MSVGPRKYAFKIGLLVINCFMLTIEIQWHYFSLLLHAGSYYSCPLSHYCFMLNNKKIETRVALPYLRVLGLEFKKKALSYLKSAPSNLSKTNF